MNYACKGSIKVNSIEEFESYRQTLGLNAKKTHIKNLIINSNLNLESLNLATPCKVTIVENNSLNVAGNICLNAKNGIHIKNGFNLRAKNVYLTSENKVVIRDHANIEVDDLSLISTGDQDSARVHIRHTSSVKTKNLTLSALKKATLGHTSNYQVLEKLTVESNGEDLEDKQWSSIWKNTTVEADSIFFESRAKLKIAKGVKIIANSVTLTGAECKISKRSVIESPFKDGNCLLTNPPDNYPPSASFTISNSPYETGKTIFFDAGNSSDDKKVVRYVWKFDQGITKTTYAPQTSFTYQEGGEKKIVLTVFDAEGLKSVSSQTIFVKEVDTPTESFLSSYFKFEIDDGIIELTFTPKFGETPIESAVYKVQETGQSISLLDFHYGNKNSLELLDGTYNIELTIKDKLGFESKFSHLVKVGEDNPPFVKFDVSQSSVTSAFLNLTDSFVHTDEISKVEVNWGDGQVEILDEDTFYKTHEYQDFGSYNITVKIYDEDDLESSSSQTLEMKSEFSDLLSPYALFEAKVEDFAGHVRFYVEKSASPNGQIISYEWNLGDGNVSYEKDPVHFYEAGIYFPKLTVTDSLGQKSSQTQRVVIENDGAPLLAGFECWGEGDYRGCWVAGVHKYSQIEKLKIDWGDGLVEEFNAENGKFTEVEQNHFYQSEGEYTAKFSVHTFDGQSDEKQETFVVGAVTPSGFPVARLTCITDNFTTVCENYDSFSPSGAWINYYSFDMGDGTIYEFSHGSQITHTYQNAGEYNVKLIVRDEFGKSDEANWNVFIEGRINQPPIAHMECFSSKAYDLQCDGSLSSDPDGTILLYEYFIDGQKISEGQSLNHTFETGGEKQVKLIVTDNEGAQSEIIHSVSVLENQAPVISSFNCSSNYEMNINCSSFVTDDENLITLSWYVNGQLVSNDSSFNYSVESIGEHEVKLVAIDFRGLAAEKNERIEVLEFTAPIVDFSCNSPEVYKIECNFSGFIPAGLELSRFEWMNKDNVIGNSEVLSYEFTNYDSFEISLKVTDRYGKNSIKTKTVDVKRALAPSVDISSLEDYPNKTKFLIGDNITLSAKYSSAQAGEIISYKWFVDNNLVSNSENFTIDSSLEKKVTVKLEVENSFHEVSSLEKEISISQMINPKIEFTIDNTEHLRKVVLDISNLPPDKNYEYEWSIIEEDYQSNLKTFEMSIYKIGTINVSLKVKDSYGYEFSTNTVILNELLENEKYIEIPREHIVIDGENSKLSIEKYNLSTYDNIKFLINDRVIIDSSTELLNNEIEISQIDYVGLSEASLSVEINGEKITEGKVVIKSKILLSTIPSNFKGEHLLKDTGTIFDGTTLQFETETPEEFKLYTVDLGNSRFGLVSNYAHSINIKNSNLSIRIKNGENFGSGLNDFFYSIGEYTRICLSRNLLNDAVTQFADRVTAVDISKKKNKRILYLGTKFTYNQINQILNSNTQKNVEFKLLYNLLEESQMVNSISFIIQDVLKDKFSNKEIVALVDFSVKGKVFINYKKFLENSEKYSEYELRKYYQGVLEHEYRHVSQHLSLGCAYYKYEKNFLKKLLEVDAQRSVFVNSYNESFLDTFIKLGSFEKYSSYYDYINKEFLENEPFLLGNPYLYPQFSYYTGIIIDNMRKDNYLNAFTPGERLRFLHNYYNLFNQYSVVHNLAKDQSEFLLNSFFPYRVSTNHTAKKIASVFFTKDGEFKEDDYQKYERDIIKGIDLNNNEKITLKIYPKETSMFAVTKDLQDVNYKFSRNSEYQIMITSKNFKPSDIILKKSTNKETSDSFRFESEDCHNKCFLNSYIKDDNVDLFTLFNSTDRIIELEVSLRRFRSIRIKKGEIVGLYATGNQNIAEKMKLNYNIFYENESIKFSNITRGFSSSLSTSKPKYLLYGTVLNPYHSLSNFAATFGSNDHEMEVYWYEEDEVLVKESKPAYYTGGYQSLDKVNFEDELYCAQNTLRFSGQEYPGYDVSVYYTGSSVFEYDFQCVSKYGKFIFLNNGNGLEYVSSCPACGSSNGLGY